MNAHSNPPVARLPSRRDGRSLNYLVGFPVFMAAMGALAMVLLVAYFDFRRRLDAELYERAKTVADSVRSAATTITQPEDLHRFVSSLGANRNIELIVVVTERKGKVIASTEPRWLGQSLADLPDEDVAADIRPALRSRQQSHGEHEQGHVFDFTVPLLVGRAGARPEPGVAMIHLNVAEVRANLRQSFLHLSLMLASSVLLAALIAMAVLRRHIVRPLGLLSEQISRAKKLGGAVILEPGAARPLVDIVTQLNLSFAKNRTQEIALQQVINNLDRQRFAVDQHNIVAVTDRHGVILSVNEHFCRISGYTREELLGQTHRVVSSGLHPPEFFANMWRVITSGGVWRAEICNRAKSGQLYWQESTILPLTIKDGKPTQFIAILTDITHLKRIEAELTLARQEAESATQAKSDFLATMSHEIRTPMNGIIGFADLMLEQPLPPVSRTYATMLKRSAESLLVIVNDILDYSKIEAGMLSLEAIPVDPTEIVQEAMLLLHTKAQERALELVLDVHPRCPAIVINDPTRLRQVVLNLVNNAIKFTERGSVTVALAPDSLCEQPALRISISDTGIGISSEKIEGLFQRFVQADTSTTRRYGGTGLGLSICRNLVDAMKGTIGVKSAEGEGSTFWFVVPLGVLPENLHTTQPRHTGRQVVRLPDVPALAAGRGTSPASEPSRAESSALPPRSGHVRVLVVDDTEANRILAVALLEKIGVQAFVACHGQEAVELVQRESFDLVLMDCHMPHLDGCGATRAIRSLSSGDPRLPIVALSASTDDQNRCFEAGMNAFLAKPVRKADLIEVLSKHVPHYRAGTANAELKTSAQTSPSS